MQLRGNPECGTFDGERVPERQEAEMGGDFVGPGFLRGRNGVPAGGKQKEGGRENGKRSDTRRGGGGRTLAADRRQDRGKGGETERDRP